MSEELPNQPPQQYPPPPGSAVPYPGQPYTGQPWTTPPAYGWNPRPVRNGLTTAGLVLGILGIVPLAGFFVPNVLAIVFGLVGRARAKRGESTNGAVATAAVVLGIVGLVVSALVIVYVVHKLQHDCRTVDGRFQCDSGTRA